VLFTGEIRLGERSAQARGGVVSSQPSAVRLEPLVLAVGQPLRVAVYSRIAEAIRSDAIPLGSLLPNETDLGLTLGVSRTVVREALMLLEEDGLIRTRRGIGRFVVDELPGIGLEQLRPIEEVLSVGVEGISRITAELQTSSDFVARGLDTEADAPTWFWESMVRRGDEAIAISQENILAGSALSAISSALAEGMEDLEKEGTSLLAAVGRMLKAPIGPGECQITVGAAGKIRGKLLGVAAKAPMLILTQTASLEGRPFYLAKHIVTPLAGHLSVIQAPA
jgi:GntR family transcriptional regulator